MWKSGKFHFVHLQTFPVYFSSLCMTGIVEYSVFIFSLYRSSHRKMCLVNSSLVTEFVLMVITEQPSLQIPKFLLFLIMYMINTLGNLTLVTLIILNSDLHIPIYSFLSNLSFIFFSFSSVIIRKMLMNFILKRNIISYMRYMTQADLFSLFAMSELYVLTSVSYGHYVAISQSLFVKHCQVSLTVYISYNWCISNI